jgi:hypothetical protein
MLSLEATLTGWQMIDMSLLMLFQNPKISERLSEIVAGQYLVHMELEQLSPTLQADLPWLSALWL